jgi:hypothetical protein
MVGLVNPTGGARWLWIGFVLAIWSGSRASGVPGCPVASWPRLASYLQIRRARGASGGSGCPVASCPGLASYSQIGRVRVRPGVRGARWLPGLDWLRTRKFVELAGVRGSGVPGGSVAPDWLRTCKFVGFGCVRGSGCPAASWPRLASYSQIHWARAGPGFRVSGAFLAPDWLRTRKLVGLRCVRVSEAPGGFLAPIGFVLASRSGSGASGVPGFRRLLGPGLASYSQIGRAPVRSSFRGARWLLGPDWLRPCKSIGSGAAGVPGGSVAPDWLRTCKSIGLGAVRGSGFPVASWPRLASYWQIAGVGMLRGRPDVNSSRLEGGAMAGGPPAPIASVQARRRTSAPAP